MIDVELNGVRAKMQFDTGSDVSEIDVHTWRKIGKPNLEPNNELTAFGGTRVQCLGQCAVKIGLN